jgi:pimeloyl-ACP methyl ester carboxylesterase
MLRQGMTVGIGTDSSSLNHQMSRRIFFQHLKKFCACNNTLLTKGSFCFFMSADIFSATENDLIIILKLILQNQNKEENQMRNKTGLFTVFLAAAFSMMSAMDALAELPKKTFVLVHGAFADQSVWDGPNARQGVAEQLRQRGYRVVTVTLPGMGRNYGQTNENINLDAHVKHVADTLLLDNVTDAIMVCHSYAGMICAGVQAKQDVADRIEKMVFFDAVVPKSGESFFSAIGMPLPEAFPSLEIFYQALGIVPEENLWCFPNVPAQAFSLSGANADWLNAAWNDDASRQHCQPIHTFDQPLVFNWNDNAKKYFIHAEDDAVQPWFSYNEFKEFARRAAGMGWNMHSLPNSHYTFISNPDDTVRLLMLIDSIPYENWPFSFDVTQLDS